MIEWTSQFAKNPHQWVFSVSQNLYTYIDKYISLKRRSKIELAPKISQKECNASRYSLSELFPCYKSLVAVYACMWLKYCHHILYIAISHSHKHDCSVNISSAYSNLKYTKLSYLSVKHWNILRHAVYNE